MNELATAATTVACLVAVGFGYMCMTLGVFDMVERMGNELHDYFGDGGRMSATERLRELLDERGVEHKDVDGEFDVRYTTWRTHDGAFTYEARERELYSDHKLHVETTTVNHACLICTPEQAIEATLGRGECRADETDTIKAIYNDNHHIKHVTIHVMECSACGHTYEHVNGDYEYCPRCGRKVVER